MNEQISEDASHQPGMNSGFPQPFFIAAIKSEKSGDCKTAFPQVLLGITSKSPLFFHSNSEMDGKKTGDMGAKAFFVEREGVFRPDPNREKRCGKQKPKTPDFFHRWWKILQKADLT